MAERLFPRPESTLVDVAMKKLALSEYYSEIAPSLGGKLIAFQESVIDGRTDLWLEYVPDCYKTENAVPLVISVHGGG